MDYDLNRLGEREFEQLTQALALKVLGPGIEVFGDGPDGGREATFEGRVSFPEPDPVGPWDGYGVVQAKFHYRPRNTSEEATWLKGELTKEFDAWLKPDSKRGRRPEYFLAVTNVTLSGKSGTGGIDSVKDLFNRYTPKLGLKGWHVWHYAKVCRLLDAHPEIARRYYGFIMPGDILAQMHDMLAGSAGNLEEVMGGHVVRELRAEHTVRLDQAGANDDRGIALPKVAIDLPARLANGRDVSAAAHVIDQGNQVLRPSTGPATSRLVILGGPGQGKTTLAQIICQAYRVALLADADSHTLAADVRAKIAEFRGALDGTLEIGLPASRRWPVHIRLDQYADALSRDRNLTLLRYIARGVSKRAEHEMTTGHLAEWLERWPWLVVLDGLDEVADLQIRDILLEHIAEFQDVATRRDADLLLIATTRPQGYADEFDPGSFEYLTLSPLGEREALQYAERLAEARHPDDVDKRAEIMERVRGATREDRTARLMRSPLQVTIMSLLLERRRAAPRHRYELFRGYYEVVRAREQAKRTADAELLERHEPFVDALQEAVGLLLQQRSERQGDAEASLPDQKLRTLAAAKLREVGHDPDDADALAGRLVGIALKRLVLLVPMPDGGIGFEVPSLREFMAARALASSNDTLVWSNMQVLVSSAHWRDTWLLAAGKLFTDRKYLCGELLTAMRECDASSALSMMVAPAAHLAIDMLAERITEAEPRYEIALVRHALDLLRKPPDQYLVRMAEVLGGVASRSAQAATAVEAAVAEAAASAGPAALSAIMVNAVLANGSGTVAGRARRLLDESRETFSASDPRQLAALASLRANYPLPLLRGLPEPKPEAFESIALLPLLEPLVQAQDLAPGTPDLVGDVLTVIAEARVVQDRTGNVSVTKVDRGYLPDLGRLDGALGNPQAAKALVRTAEDLGLADWPIASLIRRVLRLWLQRQPVEHLIQLPDLSDPEG